ncbi:hypothetical protein [Streptomyces brasiliensis]|uniref:Uncharacterized protein n=1 Tax=Streptomyces brasiliensis TaxID=1954 RepID=A0A917KT84_9ACTN|nr:hypothetical protein [Streptomyces brasiliensis]GGJ28389.1 hypothetical protein GCM10010121_044660 [Streptomyces brasiliensis]
MAHRVLRCESVLLPSLIPAVPNGDSTHAAEVSVYLSAEYPTVAEEAAGHEQALLLGGTLPAEGAGR